jgi:hypothetical protein
LRRHQFGNEGVDSDLFEADADGRNEAPEGDTFGAGLERHDRRGQRIPDQGVGEDRAPADAISDETKAHGADEHTGEGAKDEESDAGRGEEAGRLGDEQTAPDEARGDIRRHEEIVELEHAAERDQQHEVPDGSRKRQPVETTADDQRQVLIQCPLPRDFFACSYVTASRP